MADNSGFPGMVLFVTLITYWIGLTAGIILSKHIGTPGFLVAGIVGIVISGIAAHVAERHLKDRI